MKAKIGFIGAGARACCYAVRLKDLKEVEVEYTAICDINPEFGSAFNQFYADGKAALYTDYREMLRRHPDLDAVVICVPTDMHEETAVACLSADIHVLLEKPLAKTPQSCFNILTAARNHTKSATLGFVLRYTPFYGKCRELVNSGLCGDILTVNAEDIVGLRVTRFMTSGWRRKQAWSGGSLLEKCCHDLDILNWIMGKLHLGF